MITAPPPPSSSGLSTAAIIFIVCGSLFFLVMAAGVAYSVANGCENCGPEAERRVRVDSTLVEKLMDA